MTDFYVFETDLDKKPIGEGHGPFATETEAIDERDKLAEREAHRRLSEALAKPRKPQDPLISFGVFAEES